MATPSASTLQHATGGQLLGTSDRGSYWAVPKADGGYDVYQIMPNGYDVGLSSFQDAGVGLNRDFSKFITDRPTGEDVYTPTSNYSGGGGTTGYTPEQEKALYDTQIANIQRLLGTVGSSLQPGLDRLGVQRRELADQKARTMSGYEMQDVENAQDKQKGVEGVDSFVGNSYKNLMRLLGGAGAGSSSASRELVPYLISKSGDTRRAGVFDTAGRNARDIQSAREEADMGFVGAGRDLDNQELTFRQGILSKQNELSSELANLQAKRAIASGADYEGTLAATRGTEAGIQSRMEQLNALFGQFQPKYNPIQTKVPELGKFTIDPAEIKTDQNIPGEANFYMSQYHKRKKANELA